MAAIKEAHKMDYIMETVGLRKAYKDNIVVDDVNMHISKGAIYGFVGPNGAGKSTVMKMILSLIQPDAGEVQLLGEKVTSHSYEIFKKVGSIIENPYFYDKMTARQNLELHCEYMGFPNKERIDEVLHLVDLQNVEKKQVCHYSLHEAHQRHSSQHYEVEFPAYALPRTSYYIRIYDNPHIRL